MGSEFYQNEPYPTLVGAFTVDDSCFAEFGYLFLDSFQSHSYLVGKFGPGDGGVICHGIDNLLGGLAKLFYRGNFPGYRVSFGVFRVIFGIGEFVTGVGVEVVFGLGDGPSIYDTKIIKICQKTLKSGKTQFVVILLIIKYIWANVGR